MGIFFIKRHPNLPHAGGSLLLPKDLAHLYYKTESQLCQEKAFLGLTNQRCHAEIKTYGIPLK